MTHFTVVSEKSNSKKYNICLVSPDPSISRTTEQVVQELGDDLRCNVIIIDGNVKTAVRHVKPYVEKGIDAIISRGGTAIALTRAYPQLPVIAIQIEATDILKAIQGIPDGTKIGFISYSEVIYQYQALAELMGVHKITFFRLFHLGDEDTVIEQYVRDAWKQGIEVLIGSIHVREYAKKYNLRFVFLESGKGAILRAIREAASTILVRCQDRDEFKLISNIVDYTFTGTAVFDSRGRLQKWNPAFASMFAGESGTDWKVRIPLIFSSSRLQKVLDGSVPGGGEILRTEERDYAVTWQPVWEGAQLVRAIAFVQPVEQVRVGGSKVIPVDVRIIAATNQKLEQAVEEKKFRLDLFYRLDVLRIRMPALRERTGDIPLLSRVFLASLNQKYKTEKSFAPEVLRFLNSQEWPGNVRQLMNTIERMVLLSDGYTITLQNVQGVLDVVPDKEASEEHITLNKIRKLSKEGKTYSQIASILGISRSTLWRFRQKEKI